MRKVQTKTYYVCRRCKHAKAVVVSLHRPVVRQRRDMDTRKYVTLQYSPKPARLLLCLHCGSLDFRGGRNYFLRRGYKVYPHYLSAYHATYRKPSVALLKKSVAENFNIREAEKLDREKKEEAEREDSDRRSYQESVSAEVRESSRASDLTALRVQRTGRK